MPTGNPRTALSITHDGLRWQFAGASTSIFPFFVMVFPAGLQSLGAALVWIGLMLALHWAMRRALRKVEFELVADASGLEVRRSTRPFALRWAAVDRIEVDGTRLAIVAEGACFDVIAPRSMVRDLPRVAEWLESARQTHSEVPALEPVPADLEQFVARSRALTAGG
jgi:hypothetical protein